MSHLSNQNLLAVDTTATVHGQDQLSLIVTPPDKKPQLSPRLNGSPLLPPNLTPAQKQYKYQHKNDKNQSVNQLNALLHRPKSPILASSLIVQPLTNAFIVQQDKQLQPSNKPSSTSGFMNLSMRNANKTINVNQKESFLRQSRDSMTQNSYSNVNYLSNNFLTKPQENISNNSQQNNQKVARLVAQKLRFSYSKSPPQNLMANVSQQTASSQLPQINIQRRTVNTSSQALQKRKSFDNKDQMSDNNNEDSNFGMKDQNSFRDYLQQEESLQNKSKTARQSWYPNSIPKLLTNSNSQEMSNQRLNENTQNQKDQKTLPEMFNPKMVKLKLKPSPNEKVDQEILLDKEWIRANVPHITNVIKDVKDDEGVEITINCNIESFNWIIQTLKTEDISEQFQKVNNENCLNLVVSSLFLGLEDLYQKLWRLYFSENFVSVINNCKLNLKNMSSRVLQDIAEQIQDDQLLGLEERKDKFISQIYRAKCTRLVNINKIQACLKCFQVQTKSNMELIDCEFDAQNQHTFITAHGRIQIPHQIDGQFDMTKFLNNFRDKYRVCWKEIQDKLNAIVADSLQCEKCNEWFPLTKIGLCQTHINKPLINQGINDASFICCMKNEIAFQGCMFQDQSGCDYDFHQPNLNTEVQKQRFEKFKQLWPLIKDQNAQQTEVINNKYDSIVAFEKPKSYNYNVSFSQAYRDQSQLQINNYSNQQTPSILQNLYEDVMFKIPQAADKILVIQNDGQIREQIAKQAKLAVRSRSPNQQSSLQNIVGSQIRVTLDVDTNQLTIVQNRKRSLSPYQIKEVQTITRLKLGQHKFDIIREDDQRSMKLLTKMLKQQRSILENDEANDQAIDKTANTMKTKMAKTEYSDFINFAQMNEPKIIKSGREILNKRMIKSTERKKSPVFIIKQKQILRKASPQ